MRILHADDHTILRSGLRLWLRRLQDDVTITEASSFDEACEALREDEDFDLVIVDLLMPAREPFAGLQELLEFAGSAPVVVLSVIDDRRDILRAIEVGAAGFIPKSTPGEEILNILRLIQSGQVWIPQSVRGTPNPGTQSIGTQSIGTQSIGTGGIAPDSAPPPGKDPFASLSPRESEVLELILQGKSNNAIAEALRISPNTVKLHVSFLLKALNVANRTEAAGLAHAWRRQHPKH